MASSETSYKGRDVHSPSSVRTRLLAPFTLLALLIASVAVYSANVARNPPGFYIDESSVAFNAHLIATTGRDEHGTPWPLFFRCFGEYKNPVYIYLLAAVFRITGPDIGAARTLSAILGIAAAGILGMLGWRISGRRSVGILVGLSALLTPWLFELSRVVIEVAMFPLALALFLFVLYRIAYRERWSWKDSFLPALMLALVTYTYSTGRLFGPLLTAGLFFFVSGVGIKSVLKVWLIYGLTLVPLLVFQYRHPGSLTNRFELISYITPQSSLVEIVFGFISRFLGNLSPSRMLIFGDPNPRQFANLGGSELVLVATFALALAGIATVFQRKRSEAWWRFVLYGLVISIIPASLTREYFHMLRLAALPTFILVVTIPSLELLTNATTSRLRRVVFVILFLATIGQGAFFQFRYHRYGMTRARAELLDADYPSAILPAALATRSRPIIIADAPGIPGYIQAFWYATLWNRPLSEFMRLDPLQAPPKGATVISTEGRCWQCEVLYRRPLYMVYVTTSDPRPALAPLPLDAFAAEIRPIDGPISTEPGVRLVVRAKVKNSSRTAWQASERIASSNQVSLGNHWLTTDGRMLVHDDARTQLPRDLAPGEECELELLVNVPALPGEYLLELDMLQEGVSWFGLRGSRTSRLPVRVLSGWLGSLSR